MFQGGNYVFKHIFDINWHQFAPENYQKTGPLKGQIKGQVKRFTKNSSIFFLSFLLETVKITKKMNDRSRHCNKGQNAIQR